jgi:SHS2 domain-containing protein
MIQDFELLPHTADIKVRIYGKTLNDFFRNAVIGMFQVIHPLIEGSHVEHGRVICPLPITRKVEINAPDIETLMVDFLSELLYLSDVHNEAYLDATIYEVTATHIKATVHGSKVKGFDVVEIKAVTYGELEIKQINDGWRGEIVFDI